MFYLASMKRIVLALISLYTLLPALAQEYTYRSAQNPYYWKNRKPYDGYWQQDVHYDIKATLDDKTDIISGEEVLTYFNNSPDTLHFLYFHLYQNAFVKGSYLEKLNKANGFKQKFGKYEADGLGTSIEQVKIISVSEPPRPGEGFAVDGAVNKYDAAIKIDFSIMRVELTEPLMPGKSLSVQIRFKTYFDNGGTQRRRMKLFKDNWGNKHYDVVHWYPRICVYDRKFGWETDQHLGKEFYGDFGSYHVELTLPNHFIMDGTGVLQNRNEVLPADLMAKLDIKNFKDKPWDSEPSVVVAPNGTTKTWKYRAVNTHDFAWTTDPTYRIGETVVTLSNGEKVSCISLAQEPHASGWQDAAKFCGKVIETYSRDIGNYAYPKMIVADARDGMEYPMLTLDGGRSPGYYGLIAHEVGHNWFFGMVGNNETYRASLDEGFTQFLTNWSMTSIFGEVKPGKKDKYPVSRMDQTVYQGYIRDAMSGSDMQLNTHSDDFNGALNHGGGYGNVYYKTATMLYNLQYVLGDELFLAAMQHYFDQWKMAHPYFEDFRSSIINFTHVDLNWFFDQWMETTKRTDYAVWSVNKNKGDSIEIEFLRKGSMQMPLDFTVITKDSTVLRYHIPNTYFTKKTDATVLPVWKGWGVLNVTYTAKIALPAGKKLKNVIIDPSCRLADVYQMDNSLKAPISFGFDNGRKKPFNRKVYSLRWRPDLWYNSIDGAKGGLHLNGQFLHRFNTFSATVWYNSNLGRDISGETKNQVDFTFNYRTGAIGKNYFLNYNIRNLDGLLMGKVGIERGFKNGLVELYFKGLRRPKASDLDYLLYPAQWQSGKRNNSVNLDMQANYTYSNGYGELKETFRAPFFSDYDYSRITISWINHHNLWKFELHSRLFMQVMDGSNIAPESQLYLAGANPEEMMDNKFIRSRAFVPTNWLGYGNDVNHFHAGGGLNIRGYAGYVMPKDISNTQVYLFTGRSGSSVNMEVDFDKLVPFSPGRFASYVHLDTYLFADAGYISTEFKAGEYGLTEDKMVSSDLLASAGTGIALTIKRWGKLDEAKPLTLRFDMPLFLNNTPFVDGEYLRFRWIAGISRSF